MSDPTPPAGGPVETPPEVKAVATKGGETAAKVIFFPPLLSLWILLAGIWKTGEVAWFLLRALARLIA